MTRIEITLGLLATIGAILVMALIGANEDTRMAEATRGFQVRSVERGAKLFDGQCALCHGPNAGGGKCPPLNQLSGLHGGSIGPGIAWRLEEMGWERTMLFEYVVNVVSNGRNASTRPWQFKGNRGVGPHTENVMAMPPFAQANNGPLRPDQIRDIANYIVAFQDYLPTDPKEAKAFVDAVPNKVSIYDDPAVKKRPDGSDPAALGEYLFNDELGCKTCHSNVVGSGPTTCPNLGAIWTTAATRIFGVAVDPLPTIERDTVASAGDVNGDGYSDVLINLPGSPTSFQLGVFHGGPGGIPHGTIANAHDLVLPTPNTARRIAAAGDLNGDGYGDVMATVPILASMEGELIFHGSPTGVDSQVDGSIGIGGNSIAQIGDRIAAAGDVNGDGFSDVIVGVPSLTSASGVGAAFLFQGGASGIGLLEGPDDARAKLLTTRAYSLFGWSVASAGDVNGDGYADVIVGEDQELAQNRGPGAAYVFNSEGGGRLVGLQQRRGNGSGIPVRPLGRAESLDSFDVAIQARRLPGEGSTRVRGQVEVCAAGLPFGNASCTTGLTPAWVLVSTGTPEVEMVRHVSGLAPNTLYRWRARVLSAPATGPIPANPIAGPWLQLPTSGEANGIRTVPEVGVGLGLAAGLVLLGGLRRRRSPSCWSADAIPDRPFIASPPATSSRP